MKSSGSRGNSRKHSGTSKSTRKHSPTVTVTKTVRVDGVKVTVKATMAKAAKARGLALGEAFPVCASEAVASTLRLAGGSVSDSAVLALHQAAGGSETVAVTIGAALRAASVHGLAGTRPLWYAPEVLALAGCPDALDEAALLHGAQFPADRGDGVAEPLGQPAGAHGASSLEHFQDLHLERDSRHALILGLDLPGAHAVLATADGWWSWGELHDPAEWPGAVVEEAWAVAW